LMREHQEWFDGGTTGPALRRGIREKYEDIVNPDLYADAAMPALWFALRDAVQFGWIRACGNSASTIRHPKPLRSGIGMIATFASRRPR